MPAISKNVLTPAERQQRRDAAQARVRAHHIQARKDRMRELADLVRAGHSPKMGSDGTFSIVPPKEGASGEGKMTPAQRRAAAKMAPPTESRLPFVKGYEEILKSAGTVDPHAVAAYSGEPILKLSGAREDGTVGARVNAG